VAAFWNPTGNASDYPQFAGMASPAPSLAVLLPGAPQRHSQIRYGNRSDTAAIMPSCLMSSITAGQPWCPTSGTLQGDRDRVDTDALMPTPE